MIVEAYRRTRLRAAGRPSLWRDRKGAALVEFGFSLPIVLGLGVYALETASLALANLRVSQIALNLADNASRVGSRTNMAVFELREVDLNDVLDATIQQAGTRMDVGNRGRIILSSLEEAGGRQRIHWQRCVGVRRGAGYDSSFGVTDPQDGTSLNTADDGTTLPVNTGMGPADSQVFAPPGSGVMFVEINYQYQPLFSAWMVPPTRIHYTASFIVRDRRDFRQIYNPNPTARAQTCDRYNAAVTT